MDFSLLVTSLSILSTLVGVFCSENHPVYDSSYGFLSVLNVDDPSKHKQFCCNYQQWKWHKIAPDFQSAVPMELKWWHNNGGNLDICSAGEQQTFKSSAVVPLSYRVPQFLPREPCLPPNGPNIWQEDLLFKTHSLEEANASAALFIIRKGYSFFTKWDDYLFAEFRDPALNRTNTKIPVFYIYNRTFSDILKLSTRRDGSDLQLRFYRPASFVFDSSMLIIWLLAMVSVVVGGVWSGKFRFKLWREEENRKRFATPGEMENSVGPPDSEEETTPITWCTVGFMLVIVVGMLLLAYYFRSVMIWVFIVLFCIGAAISMFTCLREWLELADWCRCEPCSFSIPLWNWLASCCDIRGRRLELTPLRISLLAFSFTIALTWFVLRKWPYGFVLQNMLSVFFCIHISKSIRFSCLKYLVVLLVLMLVYDLVMVFLTPYLTKDGCSIMVEVATGAGCSQPSPDSYPVPPEQREEMPILFRVPRLSDPMLTCYDLDVDLQFPPMFLGLGDIIIPGFLVSFCFGVDFILNTPYMVYGLVSCLAYGLGMWATFLALNLMATAQPALIYLIPFTLIPVIIAARIRGELGLLWSGILIDDSGPKQEQPTLPGRYESMNSGQMPEDPSGE